MKIKRSEFERVLDLIDIEKDDLIDALIEANCCPKDIPQKECSGYALCSPCWQKYFDENVEDR